MIFVTVGTHEQQFDRLIKEVNRLRRNEDIAEDVIAQTGFSTYEPESCQWSRFFPYEKMCEYVAEARIVITHGGPSSFLAPLQIGKVPIVVPRQKRFGEHVNDHQVEFCRAVKERMGNIILVEDVRRLPNVIDRYEEYRKERKLEGMNHNKFFNEQLEAIVRGLDV